MKFTTLLTFINEKDRQLLCVSISTDSLLLFDEQIGVFENSLKGREIPIVLEFFTSNGKQVAKANAGMRLGSRHYATQIKGSNTEPVFFRSEFSKSLQDNNFDTA